MFKELSNQVSVAIASYTLTSSIGPVVHLYGLTELQKSSVKADLTIYTDILGVPEHV